MGNKRPARRPALPVLLLCCLASCDAVKEDRSACPCYLSVAVENPSPGQPVGLALRAEGFEAVLEVTADTVLLVPVPKQEVEVLALSGAALPSGDGRLQIPLGFDSPPLYLFRGRVDARADTASVNVLLHKHFCRLSMHFDGPPGWGEPYWAEVRGRVDGIDLDGAPSSGDFSCRLDAGGTVRLPRQDPEEELWLDVAMPDRVVRSFTLGSQMLRAGYDWTAEDLEDLDLGLDFSVSTLTLHWGDFSSVIPVQVDI